LGYPQVEYPELALLQSLDIIYRNGRCPSSLTIEYCKVLHRIRKRFSFTIESLKTNQNYVAGLATFKVELNWQEANEPTV